MDLKSLSTLVEMNGTSGNEQNIASFLESKLSEFGKVSYDNLGSIICEIDSGKDGRNVAIVAHMDEVGLVARNINKNAKKIAKGGEVKVGDKVGNTVQGFDFIVLKAGL